ncbi:MAG TPA: electron transport complex subunit E [Clostridia bacterium]|nr:electron transport complex subunit E [Clostridia bacterium]
MNGLIKDFTKGIIAENPVFRIVLGMCPTLATSTAVENGFWMGLAVIFVLTFSNILIAAVRKAVPDKIRIPAYIVIIASFVTIVDLVMHAFVPAMYEILGIFIPLIVVNCIIFARAEAFASKNPILNSALDGIGMGIGFMLSLIVIGFVREVLGTANLAWSGHSLFGKGLGFEPALVMIMPPGAFWTMGILLGLMNLATRKPKKRRARA